MNDLPSLLHLEKRISIEESAINFADAKLKNAFLELFNKYLLELSPEYGLETPIKSKRLLKKIFIVGPPESGRKTLLKNIELIQFLNVKKNDLPIRIFEVIIENLEILNYDEKKCEFGCRGFGSFNECVDHAQGLILIFKPSDQNSILEAKQLFQVIEEKRLEMSLEQVPILIIGNKISVNDDSKKEFVHSIFEIEEQKKRGGRIRYFPIRILEEDQRVMKSLRWMIKNIL
jgi:predicted metal-binding protein